MPTAETRTGFLLYEAAEGGAGVLTRLVGEPTSMAEVAQRALAILHFDVSSGLPAGSTALESVAGTSCVAACYRCILSYYNQTDHELIDRRNPEAKALLFRMARSRL